MSKPERRQLQVWVSDDERSLLRQLADKSGRSATAQIRWMIREEAKRKGVGNETAVQPATV